MIRPWISISPRLSSSRSSCSLVRGVRLAAPADASCLGFGRGPPEPVGARAEVAARVEGAAAERAGLTAGADHRLGALAERPGQAGRQPDDEHLVGLGLLDLLLGVPGSTTAASSNGNTSTTIRSSAESQDSVIVPARNSSTMGCSSGSLSSRETGGIAGMGVSASAPEISSSSSSSIRSASTETCCFSSATLVTRAPAARLEEERALSGRADRARDEALGRVEAVDHRCHVAEPRRVVASAAADGGVAAQPCGVAPLLRRRLAGATRSPADGVHADHERPQRRVAHHRQGRGVDDDPLEGVEVDAERVGEDRLDHVAVAHRHPHRVGPVLGLDLRVPPADRRRPRARTCPPSSPRRGTPRPTGGSARSSTSAPWPAS